MMSEGWKATAYVALAVAAIACAAPASAFSARRSQVGRPRRGVESVAVRSRSLRRKAEPPPRESSTQKHTIKGMVLAPDGRASAGRGRFSGSGIRGSSAAVNAMPKGFKEKPEDFAEDACDEPPRTPGAASSSQRIRRPTLFRVERSSSRPRARASPAGRLRAKPWERAPATTEDSRSGSASRPRSRADCLTPAGSACDGVKVLLEVY